MKRIARHRWASALLLTAFAAIAGTVALACGSTETVVQTVVVVEEVQVPVPQTVVVEKEVLVEGETVIQTVVVEKEVQVAGETVVQTVVVEKEVQVAGETVIQTVVVEKEVVVETEKVVEVEKPVVVEKEVIVEKETIVEVPRRSGGEIRVATVYVPPPLYLPSAQPSPEYWKLHAWGITETLLRTDRNAPPPAYGTPGTNGIGTGWEIDGTTISFTIRDGVSFHGVDKDWGPLTAEDIVHSMTDAGKEGSRAARAPTFSEAGGSGVWDCQTISDRAFSCTFNPQRFHPDFFYLIANENGQLPIHSKRVYDELGEEQAILEPHGSGPWQVVKHVGNDELVADAVLDHWRAPPLADRLRVIEIREPSQAAAALATGEVHLAQIPSSLVLDTENRSRGRRIQINAGLGGQAIYFGGNFWTDQNHISDEPIAPRPGHKPELPWIGTGPDDENANKVRRALSMAIDRSLINNSILVGLGKPIYTHTGYEQSTPHWQDRWFVEYDPEGAKALLAEAGYPDGFEMGFWVPSDSPFVNPEVGVAIAGQWREVGIDVQIENTAYSARRPTLVDRSIDIPWHFINSAEGGFFGNMYGRWRHGAGWNSGVEFPYDVMKDWDTRYLALDRNTQGDEIIALNTEIEDYVQTVGVEIPVVELVKWYVLGPEVLDWKPYRHNENGPNSFETMLLDR